MIFPSSPAAPDQNASNSESGAGHIVPVVTHRIQEVGVDDRAPTRFWIPKMDFPKFEGSDVRFWLDKCQSYFSLFQIPDAFKVTTATMNLSGRPSH